MSVKLLTSFLTLLPMAGCVPQQSDVKQTEGNLQERSKQSNDESAQTRARQRQEILMLREQELPLLRGELERARHQIQELQGKQESLKQLSVELEQQAKRLELLTGQEGAENTTRHAEIQKSLNDQAMRNDVVIGTILLRMEELEKRLNALGTMLAE